MSGGPAPGRPEGTTVPEPLRPTREEALGLIALRYFRSHGPAPRAALENT